MTARFDLAVNDLPRSARVAIGRKGVLEVQFDRIPPHLLGGEDGLIVTGLKRLLADHCAGDSSIKNAQETLEAWYAGYRTRRAAGVSDVIETGGANGAHQGRRGPNPRHDARSGGSPHGQR
jgi:hypothetical protein